MFTRAIVKKPCKNIVKGISTTGAEIPDYEKALAQHRDYILALKKCGLEITILEADENFPDSCFIEDIALLTPHCCIITNPGAASRKGEILGIKDILGQFYPNVEKIESPGTLEAGDVMMVGKHFCIGLSERTNKIGAEQMISILKKYGMSASTIILRKVLHLKTGLSYIEDNNLIACGEFLSIPEFKKFKILEIPETEAYAANCVWINGFVLIPKNYPVSKEIIKRAGYKTIELDVSEFRKLDGGLSCLSLRF
ncbi:MAG: hypothetical protein JEY97_16195 [Bacteroidales bacterium]|nr:hypothetical protein [Bacteroidales bacterium]